MPTDHIDVSFEPLRDETVTGFELWRYGRELTPAERDAIDAELAEITCPCCGGA